MVIKLIINIVIIGCCTLLGCQIANQHIQRIREIRIFQSSLSLLETEILHYLNFLPDALEKLGYSVEGEVGVFFKNVANTLKEKTSCSTAAAWKVALENSKKHLNIKQEEYELILRFGEFLGSSDKEAQFKYFEYIQSQLKNQEKIAESMKLKYARMYRSLGILSGLTLAIILF